MTEQEQRRQETNRQRLLQILKENPRGVSKSELRRQIGGNLSGFRRLVSRMEETEEIHSHMENRWNCGPTRVYTLPREPDPTRLAR